METAKKKERGVNSAKDGREKIQQQAEESTAASTERKGDDKKWERKIRKRRKKKDNEGGIQYLSNKRHRILFPRL